MRDTSRYELNGTRLPSVTEILNLAGLVDWSMVPAGTLEAAAERGHRVHEWLELYDQGFLGSEDECDDDIEGYIAAYERFKADTDFQPALIEYVLINETYRYAGTLDRTGQLNGGCALIDLKTGQSVPDTAALQTAGYEYCLEEPHRRFALQLRPDGDYRLMPHIDRNDRHNFLAACRIAWWRIEHEGITLP